MPFFFCYFKNYYYIIDVLRIHLQKCLQYVLVKFSHSIILLYFPPHPHIGLFIAGYDFSFCLPYEIVPVDAETIL
jgi:hypothetical protein